MDHKTIERNVFDALPEPALLIGLSGKIHYANTEWEHLLGFSPDDLCGRFVQDLLRNDDGPAVFQEILSILLYQGKCLREHVYLTNKHGHGVLSELRAKYNKKSGLVCVTVRAKAECEGIESEYDELRYQLGERVKELALMQEVTRLSAECRGRDQFLAKLVERIPAGYQFPSALRVRITFEERVYCSPDFQESSHRQSTKIVISAERRGEIALFLLEHLVESEDFVPFLDEEQRLLDWVSAHVSEVVHRWEAQDELQRLLEIFDSTTDLIATITADGEHRLLYVNSAVRSLLGIRHGEEQSPKSAFDFIPGEVNRRVFDDGMRQAADEGFWAGHVDLLSGDGEIIPSAQFVVAHRNADDLVSSFSILARDLRKHKQSEEELTSLRTQDSVTGLMNRNHFRTLLDEYLPADTSDAYEATLLVIGLDDFPYLVDAWGDTRSDQFLNAWLEALQESLEPYQTLVARIWNDELAVFLPGMDQSAGTELAEQLLSLGRTQIHVDAHAPSTLSVTIGLAGYSVHNASADVLIAQASQALRKARAYGSGSVNSFDPEAPQETRLHHLIAWRARVQSALDEGRFTMMMQPILCVNTGTQFGHEMLLRMRDVQGGLIYPSEFLPACEHSGLIRQVDMWVLRTVLHWVANNPTLGLNERFSINVSARSVASREWIKVLREETHRTRINPDSVMFEITETTAIKDIARAKVFVNEVAEMGYQLAIDDFGVGFSSFSLLRHLPVSYWKFDGSFIRNLPDSPIDRHMVKGMSEMAFAMGRKNVAEHVSDERTLTWLRQFGVHYAQGNYLGEPMRPQDVGYPEI